MTVETLFDEAIGRTRAKPTRVRRPAAFDVRCNIREQLEITKIIE